MIPIGHKDDIDYKELLKAYQYCNWKLISPVTGISEVPKSIHRLILLIDTLYNSAIWDTRFHIATSGGCEVKDNGYVKIDPRLARYYNQKGLGTIQKINRALGI